MHFLIIYIVGFFLWLPNIAQASDVFHIAIGQFVEHPALDALRLGLKEGLERNGYQEGTNITWTYENAQGNPTLAAQISHKLTSREPDVIITFSTPMTQAVALHTKKIPIVFGGVTDPVSAKITGQNNITGLTDNIPVDQQIKLIKSIVPNVKTIGVIFNPGEVNSQKQVHDFSCLAKKEGIEIIKASASKSSEVSTAAKTLVGRVEAIFLPTDNTVISSLEALIRIGNQYKIPVFGSDIDTVRRGATAAYGVDWKESGLLLAKIVIDILKGVPPSHIPIQDPPHYYLRINSDAAKQIGVLVPEIIEKGDSS